MEPPGSARPTALAIFVACARVLGRVFPFLPAPPYHPGTTRRNRRRTSFKRPDGAAGAAKDDWTLSDDAGRALARICRYLYGANAGRWFWTVLIAPDGTPFNAGSGFAATEAEARKICEAMIPPGAQERGSCCDEDGEPGVE
jgi:hypothetical protein